MLLLIDNYDSFTYNLVQYFQILQQSVQVVENDQIDIDTIKTLKPDYLVISPGPNSPTEAGISLEVIHSFQQTIPILGICLGHQCLAHAFGGQVVPASEIIHGKTSSITHNYQRLFKGIPNSFNATRYHSLAVDTASLPQCFSIDAWANEIVMAISHRQYPLFGLQFHPEAILSEHGMTIIKNFLDYDTQTTL